MADAHGAPTMLLVVDVQNGFVNAHTRPVVEPVNRLITAFTARGQPVALTRFVNRPGSGYERWIGWTRFMGSPENDLFDGLDAGAAPVFVKHGYTAFTAQFEEHVRALQIERLVICGIATDGCVLKSAVDAFERGIEPVVVVDACASHAGREVHEAGVLLLGRFIGKGQLRLAESFL
jgi:nicotinamidase-related amidase